MTADRLREALRNQPFRPFTLVAGDGTRYHVSHPDMVAIYPKSERTFVVATGRDSHAVLDAMLVTALEFGEAPRSRRRAG